MCGLDVTRLAVLALGVAVIAAFGLIRRDRPWAIALVSGGYVMLMIALSWSWELGEDARTAVFLAWGGATLATLGTERSRREKRTPTPDP